MMRSGARTLSLALSVGFGFMLAQAGQAQQRSRVNSIHDIFMRMGRCWSPPSLPPDDAGMRITVGFAFNRNGEILGHPRITYETENASDDERLAYRKAVMATLQRCTPLPLTDAFADAIAGQQFRLLFDDRRKPTKPKGEIHG